jgi:hypothetical protein
MAVLNFSPTIPTNMHNKLSSLPKFADSSNSNMPKIAVPIAPIPTQTAYAVPTGNDFIAIPSNQTLSTIASTVPTVGQSRVKPSVYFKPIAHTTSNSPAATRIAQLILTPHKKILGRPEINQNKQGRPYLSHNA